MTEPRVPGRAYVVGGAVRDALLGRPVHDRDWVVVGASAQQMIEAGFRPVGRDFPVFLHPLSGAEYALARTERKTGAGYRGFAVHADPSVTLEQDLQRRDLTINAMAQDEQGQVIDPWGGMRDLEQRVLRHVGPAFAEDPVRILRVARFAARLESFRLHPDTLELMRGMVVAGEADALVPERVWQELARGLMESAPRRMFEVLRDCGALARVLPELDALWGVPQRADAHPEVDCGEHQMLVLQAAAAAQAPLSVRWACLMHDLGKARTPAEMLPRHIGHEARSVRLAAAVADRLRVPAECAELAAVVAAEHGNVHRSLELGAAATLRLLQRCDALRRPQRFELVLQACRADHLGRGGDWPARPYPQEPRLLRAQRAALAVDAGAVAHEAVRNGATAQAIAQAVARAREQAIEREERGGPASD
ncbi:multifunctional CCA addition/repair protein [Thiomonas sp.]|jgi:tRNA nucleotidyltransferase (CCA-adding enzyme)|uniref:multifunctional CCA addition/repair protein n=1 Tax=Thiomonas sp. TaxID=2047785 RepID=UPI00263120FC|nr:multifunctional CCA addition/repair protein [Thiomonas sp.]